MHLDEDVVARIVRVARERLRLDLREVEQLPSFELPAVTEAPTVSDGSAAMFATETTSDGACVGWMSICSPCTFPSRMTFSIPTIVPSTGA